MTDYYCRIVKGVRICREVTPSVEPKKTEIPEEPKNPWHFLYGLQAGVGLENVKLDYGFGIINNAERYKLGIQFGVEYGNETFRPHLLIEPGYEYAQYRFSFRFGDFALRAADASLSHLLVGQPETKKEGLHVPLFVGSTIMFFDYLGISLDLGYAFSVGTNVSSGNYPSSFLPPKEYISHDFIGRFSVVFDAVYLRLILGIEGLIGTQKVSFLPPQNEAFSKDGPHLGTTFTITFQGP